MLIYIYTDLSYNIGGDTLVYNTEYNTTIDFELNSPLEDYLSRMIAQIPNASRLVMQTLANKSFNKEDLSLQAKVRRGDLNTALNWIESLGLVGYSTSGRQKLYQLTPLGVKAYNKFNDLFTTLKEETRD